VNSVEHLRLHPAYGKEADRTESEILREVYPELLRCAQDRSQRRSERAQDDSEGLRMTGWWRLAVSGYALV
jgi:hypothetical protein